MILCWNLMSDVACVSHLETQRVNSFRSNPQMFAAEQLPLRFAVFPLWSWERRRRSVCFSSDRTSCRMSSCDARVPCEVVLQLCSCRPLGTCRNDKSDRSDAYCSARHSPSGSRCRRTSCSATRCVGRRPRTPSTTARRSGSRSPAPRTLGICLKLTTDSSISKPKSLCTTLVVIKRKHSNNYLIKLFEFLFV